MSHWHSALPLDTIGNVIDFLTATDLQACSLVSQSVLFLCRPHLFSSITIKIGTDELHDPEAFGRLLLKTPEIARYIRNLSVILRDDPPLYLEDPLSVWHRSRLSGVFSNVFDQVPHQLTGLQSLTFWRSPHYAVPDVDWNKMTLSMQLSLLKLVHLPTLTHLKLGWIQNFPISNLISCTHLKHLSAEALLIILDEHDNPSSPHGHMQLQELDIHIHGIPPISELLITRDSDGRSVLDLSGLERLTVTFFAPWLAVEIRKVFRMTHQLTEVHVRSKEILNI
jgi:hypothetical protein